MNSNISIINYKNYNGNQNLKKAGVSIEWTPELVEEYIKCSQDPIYFCETYMKIINVDKGLISFDLYDYQREMMESMHEERYTIITTCRQAGKSTVTVGFILWYVLFNSEKTVALLANKGDTAREILGKVQLAFEHLPKWLQQGVKEWNKGSFELENNSRVIAAATSASAIRGYSINCVDGNTIVTVKDKETGVTKTLTINELHEETEKRKSYNHETISGMYDNPFYEVLTEDGFKPYDGILVSDNKETIEISINEKALVCTPDHRIKINNVFIEAKEIPHKVISNGARVFDLVNVKDTHHYITNGITSHNCLFIDECVSGDTLVTVKNKRTNEITKISIFELYEKLNGK